jgi:hypothetical protein
VKSAAQPAVVYSYITGFIAYVVFSKIGLEPKPVQERIAGTTQRARA